MMSRRSGWLVAVVSGAVAGGMLVTAPGPVPSVGVPLGAVEVAGASAVAGVPYTLVDLGTLGGERSDGWHVNDRGQVAGTSHNLPWPSRGIQEHVFLWDPVTGMADLGALTPTVSWSLVQDLNERGQVTGYSNTDENKSRAFLWDPETGMRDLGTLGGDEAAANDVNELGQAVGWARTATGELHAFLWDPVTGMRDLGTLGVPSYAVAVNDAGQVAGSSETATGGLRAFLWDPVTGMRDLGYGWARSLNEQGQVLIENIDNELWDPVKGRVDLGLSSAYALNERGQVAGTSVTGNADGSVDIRGTLWDPVAGMTDLGSLGGQSGVGPTDLNELGQITGYTRAQGGVRVFLWDPVAGMATVAGPPGESPPPTLNDQGQVAFRVGGRAVLWTPASLAPRVRVEAEKAGYGNKLRVDVDPNRFGDSWTFRVQKRVDGMWKSLPGSYETRGRTDTRLLAFGPGRYRVRVLSRYGYYGGTSEAVRLTRPTVKVRASTDGARSQLRIDVDPNKGSGYWTFRVQKKRPDGTWRTLRTLYRTRGEQETRRVDLGRGTYRVRVYAKYGYLGAASPAVQLVG